MDLRFSAALLVGCLSAPLAAAQTPSYPTQPVRMIVPTSPGGVTDALARALGQKLAEIWGQQVVIENRAGANHAIALEYVARAVPDGHTLMVVAEASMVVNPHLYAKLSYDPQKDFAPVSGLVSIHHALVANPSFPPNNVGELVALAKTRPGEINYASFGVGSTGHLNMEMLQTMAGIQLVAVQYKGATPALTDVIGGHVPIMFVNVSTVIQPSWAGQVKILALGSRKRLAPLPAVPTVAESGFPEFEARSWFGLFTTGGTPPEIVARINAAVRRVFADPAFREKFVAPAMYEPITSSPAEFADFIKAESVKWGNVVRDAKVKVE